MEKTPRNDAGSTRERVNFSRRFRVAGYLLMAAGVALAAGCASAGKAKVDPAKNIPTAAEPAPGLPAGPSVIRLTGGREGFVIKEASTMDAQSRSDFDEARALIKEAQYDKAVDLLERVIGKSPELTAPRINVAIAYGQLNKPEKAEEHLKKALQLIPGHPVASNEYGLLLRKAGRFAESREVYEKSLASFPEYYPVHKNLGILCDLYLKDLVCAIEQYEIYDRAMPKDPQVKLWLADLNARSGKNLTASAVMDNRLPVAKH